MHAKFTGAMETKYHLDEYEGASLQVTQLHYNVKKCFQNQRNAETIENLSNLTPVISMLTAR